MLRPFSVAAMLIPALFLAGCGGGGSADTTGGSSSVPARYAVTGPLTPVQSTLSTSVLEPLTQATAGTPLAGVVSCANFAVNGDVLNVVNALANGVQGAAQNPQSIAAVAPQVQGAVTQLAADLQQLLASLAGGNACNSSGSTTTLTGNPLAGTPLAALGDQLLPVLTSISSANKGAGTPSLSMLAGQLSQISVALNAAYAQLPPEATTAPVLGGVLTTLKATVLNLVSLVQTASNGDPTATTAALQSTVTATLQNLLLNVLPLNAIQAPTSSTGISTQITAAISQLTSVLGSGLGSSSGSSALPGNLSSAFAPILGILNQAQSGAGGASLLTGLLSQLTSGLSAIPAGSAGSNPVTGLLNTVLPTITSALGALLGGTSGNCLFANTPLSFLCTAV